MKRRKKQRSCVVSIIIVTMGEDEYLRACLSSICEYTTCAHEIILVNNSPKPLDMSDKDWIRVIENRRNLGFARAVNKGIEAARGEMILLFNPDAQLEYDVISPLISFLHAHESAGIAGVQLVFPDGAYQNSIDIIPNLLTQFLNKSLLKIMFPRTYPSKRSKFTRPVRVPSVIGACMMIKRQVIETTGLLDEGFFLYLEETDLCKRTTDAGFEIWHVPDLNVVHHQGATAKTFDMARKIEFLRSMYRFFKKHKGPQQTAVLFGLNVFKSIIEMTGNLVLSFTTKGQDRLKKSGTILLWHFLGRPVSWGLEDLTLRYQTTKAHGYTWFVPQDAALSPQVKNPRDFMERFSDTILNRSRTTFVKTGPLEDQTIFLKRYNFKGITDTLKNLFRKSRARRAFEAALLLENAGIETPEVLFACEKRICGILLESYIATAGVDATDLVGYVQNNGCSKELIRRLARFVRRLHEMNILHVDFKGENVLVGDDSLFLIDLDRLIRVSHLDLEKIAKNLSYLNASFARDIPRGTRMHFLEEYLNGNTWFAGRKQELTNKIRAYTEKRLATRYTQ